MPVVFERVPLNTIVFGFMFFLNVYLAWVCTFLGLLFLEHAFVLLCIGVSSIFCLLNVYVFRLEPVFSLRLCVFVDPERSLD